jgi:uncharacterized protein (DUF342 family)
VAKEFSQDEINRLLSAITPPPHAPKESAPSRERGIRKSEDLIIEEDVSGSLDHDGQVHIKGRVLPGSRIRVTGILTVSRGITGGEIQCGGDLYSPFIEMSRIVCGKDILVTSHILNSRVRCAGGVYCSKGSVICGGSCRAFYTIQADVMGDRFGSRTEVQLIKSDPELKIPWRSPGREDPYMLKIVALKKLWKDTLLTLYDRSVYPDRDYDGPVFLDARKEAG